MSTASLQALAAQPSGSAPAGPAAGSSRTNTDFNLLLRQAKELAGPTSKKALAGDNPALTRAELSDRAGHAAQTGVDAAGQAGQWLAQMFDAHAFQQRVAPPPAVDASAGVGRIG